VSKFAFALGESRFSLRARQVATEGQPWLGEGVRLDLERYLDEQWPAAEATRDPCERRDVARVVKRMRIGEDGEWGETFHGEVAHKVRPHVWYFAVATCGAQLPNGTFAFEVEFDARQPDGSHFSVESAWSQQSSWVTLSVCSAVLWACWRKMCRFWTGTGALHPVIWTLAAVVLSQYSAQVLHICHLAIYRRDGQGSLALEVLAGAFGTMGQLVETTLLILIASGYTLTRTKIGDLGFSLPILGAVALLHVALEVVDKRQDEASHVFTSHDGLKGWVTLAIRASLYAWFCAALRSTARRSGGCKVLAFLRQFRLAASMYFLAYPVACLVAPVFAPYWRKAVVEFVLVVAQIACNVWLASLFLGRAAYYEVLSLGDSLLPVGSLRSRFAKDD